ncbi:MAG TPA: hypothetical protein VGI33_04455 [Paenibacillus sp.]
MKPEGIGISKELQETMQNFSRANVESMKEVQVNLEPMFEAFRKLGQSFSDIKLPLIEIPKIHIEIPKFEFPVLNIDWGNFYSEFSEECSNNAKYGWCISSDMDISSYREIGRSEDSQEIKDRLFTQLFEADDFRLLKDERDSIIQESSNEWKEFYDECFQCLEDGKTNVAIPSLMMAIEHELTNGDDIDVVGKKLLKRVQESIEEGKDPGKFTAIIIGSVFGLLNNGIFKGGITGPRRQLISRNRILHGRDDPSKWTRSDGYRLVSIISALILVQR